MSAIAGEAYTTERGCDRLIVGRAVCGMLLVSPRVGNNTRDTTKDYMKKVAILQPSYIPWKGTFDMVNMVDEFVLYDDVQYTKRDWRNRNKVKTAHGTKWLTIPITVKGIYPFPINEAQVSHHNWAAEHWKTIKQAYSPAPHFAEHEQQFKVVYDAVAAETHLAKINYAFMTLICNILQINTRITWASDYHASGNKTVRLVDICEKANADVYLSGPSAKVYLDESMFAEKGMAVEWMDYGGYAEYEQVYPPFDHFVSVLDLIFCTGADATKYMKSFT